MAPNRAIGYEGRLPWHIPDEYEHFLDSIKGNVMVMGRKSWEVFGADAKTLANIVITHRNEVRGATRVAKDLELALLYAAEYQRDIFIAGGGMIYDQCIGSQLFDEIWLSTVKEKVEGDVFFPEIDLSKTKLKHSEDRGSYTFERWVSSV